MGCKCTRQAVPESPLRDVNPTPQAAFRSLSDTNCKIDPLGKEPELPKLVDAHNKGVLSNPKNAALMPQLAASLPIHRRCDDWKLLYCLARDGCSLHTLLGKSRGYDATILVVETTTGDVFGGFTTEAWRSSATYYGVGESFVFTLNPTFEAFSWSRLNTMVMISNDECIAMGGGGDFAWCLNSDLSCGTSGESATFKNRCLTGDSDYEIFNVEVWGFVTKM